MSEGDEAVEDVHAQHETAEAPPRVTAADGHQVEERAEARGDDPDHSPVGVAREEGEAAGQLDQAEDDQHPAVRVQVVEYQPRFADVDLRVAECTDPIEDVERPYEQQQ